jgi:ketosteroid isomerase-like protein
MEKRTNDKGIEQVREENRRALVEMIRLMGRIDRTRTSAADGGYAEGRYPDFYCPDGRLDIPFMPEGLKNYREGAAEHHADAELRFSLFSEFEWVGDFEVHDCLDPASFIVFARSRATTSRGLPYENSYLFFATMRDGKIAALREYADTSRLAVLQEDLAAAASLR